MLWFFNLFNFNKNKIASYNETNLSFKFNYKLKLIHDLNQKSSNYNFFIIRYLYKNNFSNFLLFFFFLLKKINNFSFKSFSNLQLSNHTSNYKQIKTLNFFYYNNLKNLNYGLLQFNRYFKFVQLKNFFRNYNFDFLSKNYFVKFSVTDFFKYLNNYSLSKINILFLRKNKVFNKGRYSRNRQYYRTGVYWCLYVNIIAVIGIYFWFYRFNMNFGYLWWILYFFLFSLFFSRSYSLNLISISNVFKQIVKSFIWFLSIFVNLFSNVLSFKNKK